ncbi:MAG: hypothetical protein D084_Lepto4C00199G0001 [Leptospirillum sp. Group IV 'UBA BS']|nr:MAG: hypothetical protein D084_Lepto4C00199G0001 [Leptospirillum sp. Group IV 'UBA BS']
MTPALFAGKLDPRLAALAYLETPVSPTRLSSLPLSLFSPRVDAHVRVRVGILPIHRRWNASDLVKEISALGSDT